MGLLSIRQFGDPVLRERARPVVKVSDIHRHLISDMLETMRQAPGVGLAGTQVGVLDRIFVWEVGERHGAFINPQIVSTSDERADDEEGCLSLPGITYPVTRALTVVVEGLDEAGEPTRIEGEGLLARVFQHEIDHLDGVLFIDRLPDELKKQALRTLARQALGLPADPLSRPVGEPL